VAATVPLFFPALATVAGSDLIATLPARLVARFADTFELTSFDPPLAIRPFTISAVRHRRDEKSPMHDWLAGRIRKVTARPSF
ncbi:type 2 periplasmic-binding domain-containing protein, partial [Devosia indica]